MKPKVSIIVPVYNAEEYLTECISSVLAQGDAPWEAIFVDDGSTDSSAGILSAVSDPRVRVVSRANAGPSAARIAGTQAAEGDYILFLDADDALVPGAVSTLLGACDGADIVVFGAVKVKDGKAYRELRDPEIADPEAYSDAIFRRRAHGCLWMRMVRRSLLEGVFFPVHGYAEDRIVALQLVEKSGRTVFIDDILYRYRRGTASSLSQKGRRSRKSKEARNWLDYWRFCGDKKYLRAGRRLAFLYDWNIFKDYKDILTGVQRG